MVTRGEHLAYGTVTRSVPQLAAWRVPSAASRHRALRRASTQDVAARLKQQHREREAHRIGVMKIKECGLAMKLVKVEQQFDGPRLVFSFTAEACCSASCRPRAARRRSVYQRLGASPGADDCCLGCSW